ncbi:MAG: hypothetical protein ACLUFI_04300 [Oscillospiraceae bacterium]
MQDTDLMLHTLLELGESMLADGADVRRVEQTLSRIGKGLRCGAHGRVRDHVEHRAHDVLCRRLGRHADAADRKIRHDGLQ